MADRLFTVNINIIEFNVELDKHANSYVEVE